MKACVTATVILRELSLKFYLISYIHFAVITFMDWFI